MGDPHISYFGVMVYLIIYFDEEQFHHSQSNMMLNIHGDRLRVSIIRCLHLQKNGKQFDKRNESIKRRISLIDHFILRKSPKDQNGTSIEKVVDNWFNVVTNLHQLLATQSIHFLVSYAYTSH